MQAVQLVYRAELRRRWRSWVALALLVALAGGTVMAAVAAGRRTSSAFPSYAARYGYDALIYSYRPVPGVASLPEVESYVHFAAYASGVLSFHGNVVPSSDSGIFALPAASPPVVKLLAGHLPLPSEPTATLVSFTLAQQFGVHIGSTITVPFSARTVHTVLPSETPPPGGPTVRLTVVGIEADILDFPSGTPNFSIFVGPGFQREFAPRVETASAVLVRLRHGPADTPRFSADVQRLAGSNFAYTESIDTLDVAVEQSIHPQVVGWDLLALLVGLAGLAVVGQAFARENQAQAESFPTLRAVGVRPRELVWVGVETAAFVGAFGAVGAVALAWALSPLTPVGVAREAAPATGLDFDPLVLLAGAAAIVMLCIALGFLPAWRSSRPGNERSGEVLGSRRSAVSAVWRAGFGSLPSALVGTRRALQSGAGRGRLPVATALLGSCLAVTALVATAVFGASLSHLSATPSLYGQDWQLFLSNGLNGAQTHSILSAVEADSAVDRITVGLGFSSLDLRGVNVPAAMIDDVKGPVNIPVVSGHLPDGDRQIALGESTLRQMGAHLGSFLPVTIRTGPGAPRAVQFQVVGTTVFAPVLQDGGLGVGVVLTEGGVLEAMCAGSNSAATCRASMTQALEAAGGWGILLSAVPGPAGRAAVSSFAHRFASTVELPIAPTELVNFGQAVNFPLLLGIALGLFGAATLTHLLVVSVARRRRDIALVKSIGFVRRQVAAALCWQASTVAFVALGFGLPVGIALGRIIWRIFAIDLGAVSVDVVPVWLLVLIGAGVLAVANLLAAVPALSAARLQPSVALRQV